MENKKIVVALGRNAFGETFPEQQANVKKAAKAIGDLVEARYDVIITHSNGPQVGMIQTAMTEFARLDSRYTVAPMSLCGAMSEGYIGFDLQNAIRTELLNRGIYKTVSTIITQVRVDPFDSAFSNPTKVIGRYMTKEEADAEEAKGNYVVEEDGRYRRIIASPMPIDIYEIDAVRALVDAGQVVIAGGGGGIPVVRKDGKLYGTPAVIDKDFASAKLAELLDADMLVILTAVEKVAINFGKPDQKGLDDLTPADARKYIEEKQFAPGSMLPKVQAALSFAESKPGRVALITLLEKAADGISGKTGTRVHQ